MWLELRVRNYPSHNIVGDFVISIALHCVCSESWSLVVWLGLRYDWGRQLIHKCISVERLSGGVKNLNIYIYLAPIFTIVAY
jgi:hypothetical protein